MIRPSEIPDAPWTLFVYMSADNDLARFALEDLKEMEEVGSVPGAMNVIVFLDGSDVYGGPSEGNRGRLLYMQRDESGSLQPTSPEIAVDPRSELGQLLHESGGEPNMGDPRTLRAAVQFVRKSIGVERLAVNLWNHGTQFEGIAYDDNPRDHIDFPSGELEAALGGIPIDVLCADACLAASVELGQVADRLEVRELVASEELEPGQGWRYADLMRRLILMIEERIDVGERAFGKKLVESYAAGNAENKTLSAIDMHEMVYIRDSLDRLSDALIGAGGLLNNPALRELYESEPRFRYGRGDEMDLGHFAYRIACSFPTGRLKSAAQELLANIEHATVSGTADHDAYGHVYGISIYAPPLSRGIDPDYKHPFAAWADRRWTPFLETRSVPPTAGFHIPPWARAIASTNRPTPAFVTRRAQHTNLPMTIASFAPNGPDGLSIRGYQQEDCKWNVGRTDVEPGDRIIRMGISAVSPSGASRQHGRTYGARLTVPVPEGDFEPWRVILHHEETGEVLGMVDWQQNADGSGSRIL